jgi:hypothetical protein
VALVLEPLAQRGRLDARVRDRALQLGHALLMLALQRVDARVTFALQLANARLTLPHVALQLLDTRHVRAREHDLRA